MKCCYYKYRLQLAEKLCRVLNKPCRKEYVTLKYEWMDGHLVWKSFRVKNYYRLTEMNGQFEK